jgi:dTDP-4-dehydrorhamnose reductase
LARQRPELSVVADQIGSPTYANDLAFAILTIIESVFHKKVDKPGVYHYSNEGVISWYDFAYFIIQHYKLPCQLKAIRTSEYKTKAIRPKFSLLEKKKIKDTFGITPPHWHESLMKCLEKLG